MLLVKPSPQGTNPTMISVANAGDSWIHTAIAVENASQPNGTAGFFADAYIKPSDKVTIDISQNMFGNSNPLPAGSTLRIKMWVELQNANGTKPSVVAMNLQPWTNTAQPNPQNEWDNVTQVRNSTNDVWPITAGLTNSKITFTKDPSQGATYISSIRSMYYEFLMTINPDGTLAKLNLTQGPELCNLTA
jgi:hypothetical protein